MVRESFLVQGNKGCESCILDVEASNWQDAVSRFSGNTEVFPDGTFVTSRMPVVRSIYDLLYFCFRDLPRALFSR